MAFYRIPSFLWYKVKLQVFANFRVFCVTDALFLIISGSEDPSSPSHIAFTAMWKVFYSSNDTETSKGAAPAENVGAEADSDTAVKQEGSAEESKTDTAESKTETGE